MLRGGHSRRKSPESGGGGVDGREEMGKTRKGLMERRGEIWGYSSPDPFFPSVFSSPRANFWF